ncbi:cell wall-binding repeat-containing protein [Planococcus sp. X10-3]|uniref:cell wall-binding repeat-containing protein n=1 Tax=Planococcus sp. X10-3 TaxID=3061240 RepID=UPI003BAFCAE6
MLKKIIKISLMFLLIFAFGFKPLEPLAASTQPTVILDPGHGGKYGGTAGYSGNRTGYYEKHANVEVSNRIKSELEKLGFKVILTRTSDTAFSNLSINADLRERTKVANSFATGNNDNSIFVSVHHNASVSPTFGGYETYYYNNKYPDPSYPADPTQVHYSPESQRLAEVSHKAVLSSGIKEGRGLVPSSFYVTRMSHVPAVLLEVGYMSNPTEEAMIKTASFQQKVATNFAKGVNSFFNVYVVNDSKGKAVKHFVSKTDAINYAKNIPSSTVTYKKTGQVVSGGSTPPPAEGAKVYGVYHSSVAMSNNFFSTEQDAITHAKKYKNTRVVNTSSKSILWSNYLPQRYLVTDKSESVVKRFYQEQEAIAYASKLSAASVVDDLTTNILWSNFKNKNFIVRSKDKGNMISLYNREEARDYMNLWNNTELFDVWANRAVDTSASTSKYAYAPKNIYAADRLKTAIEVSKQLYPTGFGSTKPRKTVVIATSSDYADALTAGPLASYYGNAPILLNRQGSLSPDVEAELKRLKANHIFLVGGTAALSSSVESKLKSMGITVERLSGKTRYETNAKVNEKLPSSDGLIVATGANYPDALTGASVAVVKQWPIVLTRDGLPTPARLANAFGDKIVIVGGTQAVPATIEKELSNRFGADMVERLSGKTRYETSVAVINRFKDDFVSSKLVVSVGTNYPDALVSSSMSARYEAPLFLVRDDGVPAEVKTAISKHSTEKLIDQTYYIGGTISSTVKSQINGLQK